MDVSETAAASKEEEKESEDVSEERQVEETVDESKQEEEQQSGEFLPTGADLEPLPESGSISDGGFSTIKTTSCDASESQEQECEN